MSSEVLLQKLNSATSPEQKAALVAEAILEDFSPRIARVVLWCSFLPWFSDDLIRDLLKGDGDQIQIILDLPFIEKISIGYCFHAATRRGLIKKYRIENPSEIVSAFQSVPELTGEISNQSIQDLIYALYGYVITNQYIKAEELLGSIFKQGKVHNLDVFSELNEAEEFCISETVGLTPKYWDYRSQIFILLGDFDAAITCCNKALVLDRNYYQAYSSRSIAKAKMGNFDDALLDANFAIQLESNASTFNCRAVIYMLSGDHKRATFDFTRSIRYDPNNFSSYLGRSDVYLAKNKPEKAFSDLDRALAVSESNATKSYIYFNYARAKILTHELDSALDYLNANIRMMPSTGAYRRKGDLFFKLGRFEESYECYQLALSFDNENPFAYLGIGKLKLRQGENADAIHNFMIATSLENTLDVSPQNAFGIKEINLRLWEVYLREGDAEKADEQKEILMNLKDIAQLYELQFFCRKYQLFDTLLEVNLKLSATDKKKMLFSSLVKGYALNLVGRYSDALFYLNDLEKSSPAKVLWKVNAGISYWGLGDFQSANKYFEEANLILINKRPRSNKGFQSQLAFSSEHVWVNVMLGNSKNAIQIIDEYLERKDINVNEFYDLRDWSLIVKRFPENLPIGFDNFEEYLNKVLVEHNKELIYSFSWGI